MKRDVHFRFCWLAFASLGCYVGCEPPQVELLAEPANATVPSETDPQSAELNSNASESTNITQLFDGESLAGWEVTNFGGEGECRVEGGKLVIDAGYPMSGVTSTREDLPTTNYEISLDVQRKSGIDFFCGLTFPVADSHCTLIVGGWAGSVVGLSNIDDDDASSNETRKLMKFASNQWYAIRVRVEPTRIQAWIDDEQIVDQNIEGREISVRNETLACCPLGICNFETSSEFRNIVLKKIK